MSAALSVLSPAIIAMLLGFAGAIMGSYLATIALRWPDGRSATTGRSACDGCGADLRWFELIPILSFLFARGRCRRCGARIAPLHLTIEIGAATLCVVSAAVFAHPIAALAGAVLFWQLLLLAVLDHRHLWLPDRLTALLAVSGLVMGGWISDVPFVTRAAAMIGGFAVLDIIRRGYLALRGTEGMGAGDPKMFGAIAAWTGPFALPFIVMLATGVGLVAAIAAHVRGQPATAFPFGTYMAVAAVLLVAI